MAYNIFIIDGILNGCGEGRMIGDDVINHEVDKELYDAYSENSDKYIWDGLQVVENPNYEEEQAAKEKARIQELSMTRSDFFDGTIRAWGLGQNELLVLIQNLLETLPIDNVMKLIAINNFQNALNFYRKHELFIMLVGVPIKLGDNKMLIITEECLDKFFDEVDKGNKATAWQYLPLPVLIEVETDENRAAE